MQSNVDLSVQSADNLKKINNNSLFFSASCKMFLSNCKKWNIFSFPTEEEADDTLKVIKDFIGEEHEDLKLARVSKFNKVSAVPYRFRLSSQQWKLLRKKIRKEAKTRKMESPFFIKSLRLDDQAYFDRFFKMITPPFKNYPLRLGRKKNITVTGEGIFQRPESSVKFPSLPLKVPQYSPEQKQGFSKPQSASLAFNNVYPNVFGFGKRDKLVGVLIGERNILRSNRLYIYDGGTFPRPYEYFNLLDATDYYNKNIGKILFSSDKFEEFKIAVEKAKNNNQYSEPLVRMRWGSDKTSQFFIGSDTLEARLWAIEFSRIMKKQLLDCGLCHEDDNIPICFYLPDNPDLHFKEYTFAEQQMDLLESNAIYCSQTTRHEKYEEKNYEFLMAFPSDKIKEIFQENFLSKNIILTLLSQGYIHIFQSLMEKAGASQRDVLKEILKVELQKFRHHLLISDILYHCLSYEDMELADFIFEHSPENFTLCTSKDKNPLKIAAQKGYAEWIDRLLLKDRKNSIVNVQDSKGETPLYAAVRYAHANVVERLLTHPTIDVNCPDNDGWAPLMLATMYGYGDIAGMLLERPDTDVNCPDKDGMTPLAVAAKNNHVNAMEQLLAHPDTDVNCPDKDGITPLSFAAEYGCNDVIDKLLAHPDTDVNCPDKDGMTPLAVAARNNHVNAMEKLLAHPDTDVNCPDEDGITPLSFAAEYGCNDVIDKLLAHPDTDVNCPDKDGMTPLFCATENGYSDIVNALLTSGRVLKFTARINKSQLTQSIAAKYNLLENLSTRVEKISKQFTSLPITSAKKNVLNNFLAFLSKSLSDKELHDIDRVQLLTDWARKYIQNNGSNPFSILYKRRSKGIQRLFSTHLTDSMNLMFTFIGSKEITPELKNLIKIPEKQDTQRTLSNLMGIYR